MKNVKGKALVLIITMLFGILMNVPNRVINAEAAVGNTYYVSVSGDDVNGDGTSAKPFKSVQKAADIMVAGDVCIISEGKYYETITPANSGTADNPIIFQAAQGEKVTISGADPVNSQWEQYSGDIYRTDITLSLDDGNQVFVDEKPMMEARWPNSNNEDFYFNATFAISDSGTTKTKIYDAAMPDIDWTGGKIWTTPRNKNGWVSWTSPILNYSNKSIDIVNNSHYSPKTDMRPGNEYYITGKLEALDAEREWYYENNNLYLFKPNGGNPSSSEVLVKNRLYSFVLDDTSYIQLKNVNMFASTISMNDNTTHCVIDGMVGEYISHYFKAEDKLESQITNTGIIINGSHNEIKNSEIAYSSGNGVVIKGNEHRVVNNYIHDVDYAGVYCGAVIIDRGSRVMISHNTVARAGRSLVGFNGFFNNCKIQYNDMSGAGMLVRDLGALYMNSDAGNTEIHHNVLHDNNGHHGIYTDNGSSNFIIHHNVSRGEMMMVNLPQEYTLIYNNSLSNRIGDYYTTKHFGDGLGCYIGNNIISHVKGTTSEFVYINNLVSSTPGYQSGSDYRLVSNSPAIDGGIKESGITDGFIGDAPDQGAYEFNGEDWSAGHDFANPPNPIFKEVKALHRNRINNAGFELNFSLDKWNVSGNNTKITRGNGTEWYGENGWTRTGFTAAKMGQGENRLEQTVNGLEPNTTYRLTAWVKVDNGETAVLGVKGHGNADRSVSQSYTDKWVRKELTFSTSESSNSATVYLSKTSTGNGNVYWDDIGLQYRSEVIEPQNIALYKFEDNGLDATDNNLNGQINGSSFVTGVHGQRAIQLDGIDDYVSVLHDDKLSFGNPTNGFTIAAWIKTTEANGTIISKGRPNSATHIDYVLKLDNGKLSLFRWHQTPDSLESITDSDGANLNDGNWHHVAFVNENASMHKLYVDGVLVEESTTTWNSNDINTEPLHIGKHMNYTWGTEYYKGIIDEVALYNYGLTASGISKLAGIQLKPSAEYRFEDNVNDESGNNQNGILHGASFAQGKIGAKAIVLDGVDDYASISSSEHIAFGNPSTRFSISAWIKTTNPDGPILAKGRPTSPTHIDYNLQLENGKLSLVRWHQTPDKLEKIVDNSGTIISDGNWHHIAFVNEGASSHKLYVDGNLVEESTVTWTEANSNTEDLYIGKYVNYTWGTTYFGGMIDNLKIYQDALSLEDIKSMVNQ